MGLNHAVVFLVMARGSGRDNSTTRWSAEAAFKHTGIAWRRGNASIKGLIDNSLVSLAKKIGKRPLYKIALPQDSDDLIWLPNTLVTGAAQEVPPLARLRQGQDVEYLQTFIELYALHDLAGDGGLPRTLIWKPYDVREPICDRGQFKVFGFRSSDGKRYCNTIGPLKRFKDRRVDGKESAAWAFVLSMERMGLVETVDYLAESAAEESELIHALTGDEHAIATADAAAVMAADLPGGFKYEIDNFDYVLPVINHLSKATIVGIFRLTYRPHTKRTAAWYAQHVKACALFTEVYRDLARGEFKRVA
jgi:hypothetical protein